MPVLKYYYDLMSQPARAVYIFLKLNKIPFIACPVALRKQEHQTDEFKEKFNRFQKVPFIHHGDFKLAESVAIVGYIAREYRSLIADHWYPADSQGQARLDEYLSWQHINTRIPCATYFWYKWMIPNLTQSTVDEAVVAMHESNMIDALNQIEELWLKDSKFIIGDRVSVADIFAACELEQPRVAGFEVTKGRPILKAWLDRVRSECDPFYEEAHIILNKIIEKNKAKL